MTLTSVSRSRASGTLQASTPADDVRRLPRAAWRRAQIAVSVICAALVASSLAAGSASAAATAKVTETFASTGAEQSFVVPAGVTSVRVRAVGAAGKWPSRAVSSKGLLPAARAPWWRARCRSRLARSCMWRWPRGASNGGGQLGFEGGGMGGGASDVRTLSESSTETLQSRLLVAGGGGGGGGTFDEGNGGRGGDAGSPGEESSTGSGGCCGEGQHSAGGAAGTLTGGGAGGERCEAPAPWSGREGSFGIGGEGGEQAAAPETGGGGGGGGYWGGGGGEGLVSLRRSLRRRWRWRWRRFELCLRRSDVRVVRSLSSLSTEPSVSITYATPATATPDSSTIAFPGTQPLSTVSAPQTVTLTNSGGNPLEIWSETFGDSNPALASDHPEDFLIDSSSCLGEVVFEGSCQLKVRFAPQGAYGHAHSDLANRRRHGRGADLDRAHRHRRCAPTGTTGRNRSCGRNGRQG